MVAPSLRSGNVRAVKAPMLVLLVSSSLAASACDSSKPDSNPADAKATADAKAADATAAAGAKAAADGKTPDAKTPDAKTPDAKGAEVKTPEVKTVTEQKAAADPKTLADAKAIADAKALPDPAVAAGTIATIHPDTVLALESTDPPAKWKAGDTDGVYTEIAGESRNLWFRTHPFTQAGTSYTFAQWGLDQNTAQIHGALLSGRDGAWKPVWVRRPFIEDSEGPELEVYLPRLVQIGPERWAVLHQPYREGCGAEDCTPEDGYTENILYEITPAGPVEIWKLETSSCLPPGEEPSPDPNQCFLAFEPGENADVHDLVVTIQRKGKKKKPQRHVLRDGRYAPK